MNPSTIPNTLDESAALDLRGKLDSLASALRATAQAIDKPVQAPALSADGNDLLADVEALSGHVGDLATALGLPDPRPALVAGFVKQADEANPLPEPPPAPSTPKPEGPSATEKARAAKAKAKPTWSIPARIPGESVSAYCERLNRERAKSATSV
jgi:hypothetical protein